MFLTDSIISWNALPNKCSFLLKKTGLSPSLYRQKALSDRSFHTKEE